MIQTNKMNKLLKRIALKIPHVKKYYQYVNELRRENEELKKQVYMELQRIHPSKTWHLQRQMLTYESILDNIDDTINNKKCFCPLCKNEFKVFLPAGVVLRKNAECPHCNSLERHRMLALYLEKHTDLIKNIKPIRLLHFAPEPVLSNIFNSLTNIDYYPVDFDPSIKGIRDIIDIQKITYKDDFFDAIICFHVLEHIPDDHAAMKELFRCLKKEGVAYIDVPLDKTLDVTFENPEYNTPELRTQYYGQHDHVRKYGNDFIQKLQIAGFKVNIIYPNNDFQESEIDRYGLSKNNKMFLCTKN